MLWETFKLAQREIRRNVLRSTLTILGIVIGVAAVITMVTLGGGATAQVTEDISKLGTNLLHVRPGQGHRGPGGARGSAKPFEEEDAEAIAREVAGLTAVAPASNAAGQAIYGNQNWSTSVTGTTNDFLKTRNWSLASGRLFTSGELHAGHAVCMLGETVKKELFGGMNPVGERIRLGKITFEVVGVLAEKGQSGFGTDQDDIVLIPLRTLQRRIAGNTNVPTIYVSARDGVSTAKVQKDIERLLRERRRIGLNEEDDFHVRDMQEIVSTLTGTTRVLTALLGAVAAVSLLVGGIGIMNIMLVSVAERTKEIGIRKALGAPPSVIRGQFLTEAVALTLIGGLIGMALGTGLSYLGTSLLGWIFAPQLASYVLAVAFSSAVGIFFGLYPAFRASRLEPVAALAFE